jgi:hypothetical protein
VFFGDDINRGYGGVPCIFELVELVDAVDRNIDGIFFVEIIF